MLVAVGSFITIILWTYIFSYILKLEKIGCECALDWRRTFIKYYIVLVIVIAMCKIFGIFEKIPIIFRLAVSVGTLAFIIITYKYVHDLKKKKCECSRELARDVLEIVNYIQLGILVLVGLYGLYMTFTLMSIDKKLRQRKLSEM